jgi:hypothetical protein
MSRWAGRSRPIRLVILILDGFAPACMLLRLDRTLVRRHVLCQLPCIGLLLRPTISAVKVLAAESIAASAAVAQILWEGFLREKSGLCVTGGSDRQGNWAAARESARCPDRRKLGPNLCQG